jgi:hypothetical protein
LQEKINFPEEEFPDTEDVQDYVFYDQEQEVKPEEHCKGVEGTTCTPIDKCGDEGNNPKD